MTSVSDKFDIHRVIEKLRQAVADLPKAALFDLYDQGYTSLFEQLVACIISIRTYDETTIPTALSLFKLGRTPEEVAVLNAAQIDHAIRACTYHEAKAHQILAIAQIAINDHNGALPCDFDILTGFRGVGPKCANLALGIACQQPHIGVDIHVHRVTNRWGYVNTKTPERTLKTLKEKLPREYWVEINRLLVPFGKHICTGTLPHCSTCVLLEECAQVGVGKHR